MSLSKNVASALQPEGCGCDSIYGSPHAAFRLKAEATLRMHSTGRLVEIAERAAGCGELHEEGRRGPARPELLFVFLDARKNRRGTDAVGVEHRPAAPRRKPVAVRVDDVDV